MQMIMIMSVFDHCVGLALKELKEIWAKILILNRVSFVVPQKNRQYLQAYLKPCRTTRFFVETVHNWKLFPSQMFEWVLDMSLVFYLHLFFFLQTRTFL